MPLLSARVELHDVRDVEAFAGQLLDEFLRRTQGHLRPEDREDALAYVVGTIWELSTRWERGRGISFSTYAHRLGKLRVVDWYRKRFSDQRFGGNERKNIDFPLSLDARILGTNDDGAASGFLGETLAALPDDSSGDSGTDLTGIHGGGNGELAWREELRREKMAFRASERNRDERRARQRAEV